jgi:hypothetical protein
MKYALLPFASYLSASTMFGAVCALPVHAAPISFELKNGEKVGSYGQGLLCFPRKVLRWSRDFRPDSEESVGIIKEIEKEQNVVITSAKVVQIRLKLCQPYWGPLANVVGDSSILKGQVETKVQWNVQRIGSSEHSHIVAIKSILESKGTQTSVSSFLLGALRKNASELKDAIAAQAPDELSSR